MLYRYILWTVMSLVLLHDWFLSPGYLIYCFMYGRYPSTELLDRPLPVNQQLVMGKHIRVDETSLGV